jgi:putative membrane protein
VGCKGWQFQVMLQEPRKDPRIYMAAERTFLAWIRTGVAFMGFGFILARFGLFLRELAVTSAAPPHAASAFSMPVGVALIVIGILVNIVAAVRHRRYIRAIDQDRFRSAFGSLFAYAVAVFLALIGLAMAVYLAGI